MEVFLEREEGRSPLISTNHEFLTNIRKLIVILGPTASGKSTVAVQLAKKFGGEVVSADSRQVYKGLDIGSGTITKKEMRGIPHHLLAVASPKKRFTVAQYCRLVKKAMAKIRRHGNIPFIVGGSPLYIYAVVDGWVIPEIRPNEKLRRKLNHLTIAELFSQLKKLDPQRAKTIEQKNKRRLIRALEIILTTGKPIPPLKKYPLPYPVLLLGIKKSPVILQQNVRRRFLSMLRRGFLNEIRALRKDKLSWHAIENFGLEYRQASEYLQRKISKQEMIDSAVRATQDFARRQMTWFKKDKRIHWIRNTIEAIDLIKNLV